MGICLEHSKRPSVCYVLAATTQRQRLLQTHSKTTFAGSKPHDEGTAMTNFPSDVSVQVCKAEARIAWPAPQSSSGVFYISVPLRVHEPGPCSATGAFWARWMAWEGRVVMAIQRERAERGGQVAGRALACELACKLAWPWGMSMGTLVSRAWLAERPQVKTASYDLQGVRGLAGRRHGRRCGAALVGPDAGSL